MNALLGGIRPTASQLEDGRYAIFVGSSFQQLDRSAALRLFIELGDALDEPTPESLRFREWVAGLHQLPPVEQVLDHFNVSRATAYRWLAAERAQRERAAA